MSGPGGIGRNTGTVPKAKPVYRPRGDNQVNHTPNNLEWRGYPHQRVRKESNTFASHQADAGEEFSFDNGNPWNPWASTSRAADDEELRWSNVKTSNIMPERGNVDGQHGACGLAQRQEHCAVDSRAMTDLRKEPMSRARLKLKMEESERKIEEMEHQKAALLKLRNIAAQKREELQSHSPSMKRNKAVQQVRPIQVDMDKIGNLGERLQAMQEYAHIIQAFEREETGSNAEGDSQASDHLRNKLSELLTKKAQCENILSCLEPDHLPDVAGGSLSSEEGEPAQYSARYVTNGVVNGVGEIEMDPQLQHPQQAIHQGSNGGGKQDNREIVEQVAQSAAFIHTKEMKLEEVKNKLEQLQSLLSRVERLREGQLRMNGELVENPQPQMKNRPPQPVTEKMHTKKLGLDQGPRHSKPVYPATCQQFYQPAVESWPNSVVRASNHSAGYSSDEAEMEFDCPVKLCSPTLGSSNSFSNKSRPNIHQNIGSGRQSVKSGSISSDRRSNGGARGGLGDGRQVVPPDEDPPSPNNSTLALQINQLQMQMDEMQMFCESIVDKQNNLGFHHPPGSHLPSAPPPHQSWLSAQPTSMDFMQLMGAGSQWHQHQLLVSSLNQCCQLIWHQQRELAALRQALSMLQEESNMYKCGGYGNNLNFGEPGLLWHHQTSPQTLNNQVAPGNRANNYWDNFRSYSRQNLLSGRNKSNEGSLDESPPSAQQHPTAPQTDNLRRKDNSVSHNAAGKMTHRPPQFFHDNTSRLQRRFHPPTNKPEHSAVFSLEQSIYSELDTVIAEAERNPQLLIQLLTHLKNLRSPQHPSPYEESEMENGMTDPIGVKQSGRESLQNSQSDQDYRLAKLRIVLYEVNRYVGMLSTTEEPVCNPEFLQQIVNIIRNAQISPSVLPTRLEASLLKFQGARVSLIWKELLSVVEEFLFSTLQQNTNEEEYEEEGAVGGVLLSNLIPQSPQQQQLQPEQAQDSVETELAEADQTQHNSTDTVEEGELEESHSSVELQEQSRAEKEELAEGSLSSVHR